MGMMLSDNPAGELLPHNIGANDGQAIFSHERRRSSPLARASLGLCSQPKRTVCSAEQKTDNSNQIDDVIFWFQFAPILSSLFPPFKAFRVPPNLMIDRWLSLRILASTHHKLRAFWLHQSIRPWRHQQGWNHNNLAKEVADISLCFHVEGGLLWKL